MKSIREDYRNIAEICKIRNDLKVTNILVEDQIKEELFKDFPMDIALNGLGFFLTLGSDLARISHNYLVAQEKKLQRW